MSTPGKDSVTLQMGSQKRGVGVRCGGEGGLAISSVLVLRCVRPWAGNVNTGWVRPSLIEPWPSLSVIGSFD